MKHILSIQSHVSSGYVGNKAAVFPLQCLGFEVIAINTVQFSSHTGHKEARGDCMTPEHIERVLHGLKSQKLFSKISGVLTGYLGDPDVGDIILRALKDIRKQNPGVIYCCDPVIGDTDTGVFVAKGIDAFFQKRGIPQANIITPNQFEAAHLTNRSIDNYDDAFEACRLLREKGPQHVLMTSFKNKMTQPQTIEMLLDNEMGTWSVTTPFIPFDNPVHGSGDLAAALFLAYFEIAKHPVIALEKMAAVIFGILETTYNTKSEELALIHGQHHITEPGPVFIAEKVR